jgi:hypothetical protein
VTVQLEMLRSVVEGLAEAHRKLGILYGEHDDLTSHVYASWVGAEGLLTQEEKEEPCPGN